jgi:hypothetical protein
MDSKEKEEFRKRTNELSNIKIIYWKKIKILLINSKYLSLISLILLLLNWCYKKTKIYLYKCISNLLLIL